MFTERDNCAGELIVGGFLMSFSCLAALLSGGGWLCRIVFWGLRWFRRFDGSSADGRYNSRAEYRTIAEVVAEEI
jgi:hypothetical protein